MNFLFHFIASVPGVVSPKNRHLIVLDGHGRHMDVETIEEVNNLRIFILKFLAHTTHKLQPLDLSVFAPFKNYFRPERASWMEKNRGVDINRFELADLASRAFKRDLTTSNIMFGVRRTRIWPLSVDALIHDTSCNHAFDVAS